MESDDVFNVGWTAPYKAYVIVFELRHELQAWDSSGKLAFSHVIINSKALNCICSWYKWSTASESSR